jgi:hypothetical protein
VKLNIDVSPIDQDQLVELVARYILKRAAGSSGWEDGSGDEDNRLATVIEKKIEERVEQLASEAVRDVVIEIARSKVEAAVNTAIDAGWQITNQYGEPTGRTASLDTFIREHLTSTTGYRNESKLSEAIRKAIDGAMQKQFKPILDEAAAKLRAQVDTVLQAKLNETMRKALGLG